MLPRLPDPAEIAYAPNAHELVARLYSCLDWSAPLRARRKRCWGSTAIVRWTSPERGGGKGTIGWLESGWLSYER